ncbi:leucyl aminopeptidase family protein [Caulobacter mirabilis]|uniref:Aminopeptidase n=1 Tax=Caulobacter mirabilis TaxID=69666 RepID=A0A2D2B2A5_9CAUL|nr:leucyl aminopeptidase family protein [Caulobacter mirabilis]ATQ44358.1 aminopeptidase [Caulobacter mirabilis]
MTEVLLTAAERDPTPIIIIAEDALDALSPFERGLAEATDFKGKAGQALAVPGDDGKTVRVLFGIGDPAKASAMLFRGLPSKLAVGDYRLDGLPDGVDAGQAALAFALGSYGFDRYRKARDQHARLVVGDLAEAEEIRTIAHACALARDMVNTPANDMGPLQIETIAREIAEQYGAAFTVTTGDDLLAEGYPAVHAVGRAADPARAPRFVEIQWGEADKPLVAVVGKGVVFDTGGLDIKPAAGMRLMKKDMGGAAHALALGRMLMAADLPIRVAVLVPIVENAISGDAMRPGDVLDTRKGLTVEVGNTDAEGRLILCDALTRAGELEPVLTVDLATLTGAARIALGPQVIPFYTDDEDLAADLAAAAAAVADPLWRMPLWPGYEEALDGDIADLKNDPDAWAQAGSVTAALYLKRFAPAVGSWVHFDIFAWNPKGRPGHPVGAEAQAVRALYAMIKGRFS